MERWAEVLQFGTDAGLDLVFGTSYTTIKASGEWDSANVGALLNYTKLALNQTLYALELGEEMQPPPDHQPAQFDALIR
jgi:hypothetical protein